jgi:hypothetical protein
MVEEVDGHLSYAPNFRPPPTSSKSARNMIIAPFPFAGGSTQCVIWLIRALEWDLENDDELQTDRRVRGHPPVGLRASELEISEGSHCQSLTMMSTPADSRGSLISRHLRAAKEVLQDVGLCAEYVWGGGTHRVGELKFTFAGSRRPWTRLR